MRLRGTLAVSLCLTGALALSPATIAPAHAHGDTLRLEITGQRDGHVETTVTWENDSDPVDEPVSATLSAVDATGTRTAGPWRLTPLPGSAHRYTTREALAPGRWKVTVEAAFPGLGRGIRDLTVTAAASAGPAVAGPPAGTAAPVAPAGGAAPPVGASAPDEPAPAGGPPSGTTVFAVAAGAGALAAAGVTGAWWLRRRGAARR
ncbi:hypothetical protein [Streptomyces sp. NPDC050856]|uniref:hypothetical protein n=1 Tax=Streptomyces sp. NPDC050856 TaxID=3154939 RepID=UPI0033E0DB29